MFVVALPGFKGCGRDAASTDSRSVRGQLAEPAGGRCGTCWAPLQASPGPILALVPACGWCRAARIRMGLCYHHYGRHRYDHRVVAGCATHRPAPACSACQAVGSRDLRQARSPRAPRPAQPPPQRPPAAAQDRLERSGAGALMRDRRADVSYVRAPRVVVRRVVSLPAAGERSS